MMHDTGDTNDAMAGELAHDIPDRVLDALLRRSDVTVAHGARRDLESRILDRAALPLAARRRDARSARATVADTLAAWVRVAMPIAAAAAIIAMLALPTAHPADVADAELRDSDPAALLSALDAENGRGLAHHVIGSGVGGEETDDDLDLP